MKQLSKAWIRIFISIIVGAINTEILILITKNSNRLTQEQLNTIGIVSAIIFYAILTFFVKMYKKNL